MRLHKKTSPQWIDTVLKDFDAFLLDHAACERKASATAMNLVAHYPDRRALVDAMILLAREELEHFHQVYLRIAERGLRLASDGKDEYVGRLMKLFRKGSEAYFLDRLLVGGVIEARGHERFEIVAEALDPGPLKEFYIEITRSEARHHGLFLKLAKKYFEETAVRKRLDEILEIEAEIVSELPLRPAVH